MPIDDALGNIEVREEPAREPSKVNQETKPGQIFEDANLVIGDILLRFFNGSLGNQSGGYQIHAITGEAIKRFGFMSYKIFPAGPANNRKLEIKFAPAENSVLEGIVRLMYGDHIFNTDLAQFVKVDRIKEASKYITGIKILSEYLCDPDKEEDLAILDPYIMVMSIDFKCRPLSVLAVQKQLEQKSDYFEEILQLKRPLTKNYLSVAEKYGIKEVMPIMDSFDHAINLYKQMWV